MSSYQPDLRAYALGELAEADRRKVEQHLATNPEAALELERLGLVADALRCLPEEEPPRRIAFVSDKVFEPKWYERWWNSAPRLGFASAALLAVAIITHGVLAQRITPTAPAGVPVISQAEISRIVDAEVSKRMDAALTEVRAEADRKSQGMVKAALAHAEKQFTIERQQDRLAVEANFDRIRKQMANLIYYARNERTPGGAQ